MLKIDHVTKRFGSFTAVDDLTLDIPEKQMFGLLGSNGAGKTTTFRMILGLLNASEGAVTWKGKPITYGVSNGIGYLPEERGLYPKLKVKDQLVYLGRLKGMTKQKALKEMEKWLERFHITEYADKRVEELSKGNQQKIQFITAVLHKPELLILDEPFSGLDPVNVELLKDAVISLKNGGTSIVFSSHRMEHVEELCEHVCILQRGKPVVQGKLKEIKRSFGKKNVTIHSDDDLSFLKEADGIAKWRETSEGVRLQVENEEVSQHLFTMLQGRGFIRKFELEEPSLHDIFVEKVGARYE
ncbi:sodium ABC transporter ATP-binding protein [Bacillus glycinifermentans]|uniref:ABC transporter ATP-binding protein n=1 Tax=Bacillus glycinifermentans TaxID=1664069 RepID=A0A0J6HLQ2_9BACI|nr:ABC transporter ATP-binding protein [Bacillus glycinifermentans]ATH94926.1 sodium ABC transporter ATP-binding protein [Bacillus glycinifermentans]KMM63542.1 sodium ABC transporter ATP-binding protein [Bacillus glycinifermentans]KRT93117.1 sodium ABC transporter ATP-binding protein [Bacillus glycinifermentans]MEC0487717.1 ABC transporter ATP-binding protein [Bacillus glycinifermentans]MEC0493835.1 ABC transporter ATP-binding protein [Bacillus glycinifermentans]